MSDYSKTTNFTAKDGLSSGDPDKIIYGAAYDTEFDNVATASATKANKVTSPVSNDLILQSASGDLTAAGFGMPNVSDDITSSHTELNILDGVTATAAQVNFLAGVTAGTALASKALVLDGSKAITGITSLTATTLIGSLTGASTSCSGQAATIASQGALATLNSVGAAQIDTNAVGSSEIAANAVGQSEIKEGTQSMDAAGTGGTTFFAQTAPKYHNASIRTYWTGSDSTANLYMSHTASVASTWEYNRYSVSGPSGGPHCYLEGNYISASPPYDLGDGEIPLFGFVVVDSSGNAIQTQFCEDPPWAYNGPTNIIPDRYAKDGRIFKRVQQLDLDIPDWKQRIKNNSTERGMIMNRRQTDPFVEVEITQAMKNADKDIIPHPFAGASDSNGIMIPNYYADKTIVILDPVSSVFEQLLEFHQDKDAESVCELLQNDYIRFGNTTLPRNAPAGVMPVSLKWKK